MIVRLSVDCSPPFSLLLFTYRDHIAQDNANRATDQESSKRCVAGISRHTAAYCTSAAADAAATVKIRSAVRRNFVPFHQQGDPSRDCSNKGQDRYSPVKDLENVDKSALLLQCTQNRQHSSGGNSTLLCIHTMVAPKSPSDAANIPMAEMTINTIKYASTLDVAVERYWAISKMGRVLAVNVSTLSGPW